MKMQTISDISQLQRLVAMEGYVMVKQKKVSDKIQKIYKLKHYKFVFSIIIRFKLFIIYSF